MSRLFYNEFGHMVSLWGVTAKPGLWTLDWTMDWTMDWTGDDHYQFSEAAVTSSVF